MFKKLVDWFTSLWSPPIEDMIGDAYWNEYEYLRDKYGISQPFADEDEEDECKR